MAQGFGYLLTSAGPIGIGAIRDATGGWTVPLVVLGALLVPQLMSGTIANRERHVLAGHKQTVPRPVIRPWSGTGRHTARGLAVMGNETPRR